MLLGFCVVDWFEQQDFSQGYCMYLEFIEILEIVFSFLFAIVSIVELLHNLDFPFGHVLGWKIDEVFSTDLQEAHWLKRMNHSFSSSSIKDRSSMLTGQRKCMNTILVDSNKIFAPLKEHSLDFGFPKLEALMLKQQGLGIFRGDI